MFDCNTKLLKFYDDHVRLGADVRSKLAGHRDANLNRLITGLEKLGELRGVIYAAFVKNHNQGSYAMDTLNQHPENDYDIDVGVIFEKDDLPTTALESRKRVADAMKEAGGNFSKDPEARTNAVTIWYAEGHHVDLAVYRQFVEGGVTIYEHAGADWKRRNPLEVNNWFQDKVDTRSPNENAGATVRPGQLRRVVRFVKAFAKSRASWDLPGGMITTALVVECYRPNFSRDDVALYDTMHALRVRLSSNTSIINPVDVSTTLTAKTEWENQVKRFRDRLTERLPDLDVLNTSDCGGEAACDAWANFFNHTYWDDASSTEKHFTAAPSTPSTAATRDPGEEFLSDFGITTRLQFRLQIDAKVTQDGYRPFMLRGATQRLRKLRGLEFSVVRNEVPEPYTIKWKVKNTGAEAVRYNQLRGNITNDEGREEKKERTKYEGAHYVECYAIKDGVCVAQDRIDVPIGEF